MSEASEPTISFTSTVHRATYVFGRMHSVVFSHLQLMVQQACRSEVGKGVQIIVAMRYDMRDSL